jgi:DNA-binding transcriptional MerR regulator
MSKSAEAFRTISEVADVLDTPAHVLRFWESRFAQIKPVKRAGGRRYYRPADVALLGGIKKLLHEDGLTIRGVQKILREQGVRHVAGFAGVEFDASDVDAAPPPAERRTMAAGRRLDTAGAEDAPEQEPVSPLRHDLSQGAEARAELRREREEAGRLQDPLAPSDTSLFANTAHPPAAALLRAMTALRAGKRQVELRGVYQRLSALYQKRLDATRPRSG